MRYLNWICIKIVDTISKSYEVLSDERIVYERAKIMNYYISDLGYMKEHWEKVDCGCGLAGGRLACICLKTEERFYA